MRRLGKKGQTWMTEETLKVIVAVVVIFLLVLLIWKIISIFMTNTEYEQAKVVVSDLEALANTMNSGDVKYFLVESPKTWAFLNNPLSGKFCYCPRYVNGVIRQGLAKGNEGQIELCKQRSVCSNLKMNVYASGCDPGMGGISQVSFGCLYVDSVPYELKLTKDFQGNVKVEHFIDSSSNLPPVSPDSVSTIYTSSILTLNDDSKFQELIKNYLTTKSDSDKQLVVEYVSSLPFVQSANKDGKVWKINFDTGGSSLDSLTIYPAGVSSLSYSSLTDQVNLVLVSVGDTNYNVVFQIRNKASS